MIWFFWPLGGILTLAAAYVFAARVYPEENNGWNRLCATMVAFLAAAIGEVRLLGFAAWLRPGALLATIGIVAGLVGVWEALSRCNVRRSFYEDKQRVVEILRRIGQEELLWFPAAIAVSAFLLAALAAYLLPSWSWDSLGYHLPIVYDALQTGKLRWIPTSPDLSYQLPSFFAALQTILRGHRLVVFSKDPGYYINFYPKNIEYFFLWSRLLLRSDRMLDFCQAPFALAGVSALGGLLSRSGVPAPRALVIGSLFLAVPIVCLQLATNYVDVGYSALVLLAGYFATASSTRRDLLLFGIAAGLALGSKPSAPVVVGLFFLLVLVRAFRARQWRWEGVALALCVLFGGASYLENLVHFANPLFPADVRIGPLHLAGAVDAKTLYLNNVPPAIVQAGFLSRTLWSWLQQPDRYVYDMRIGGFGPLFPLFLLPALVVALWRREHRSVAWQTVFLVACAAATPAAFWTRYCLAVPGFLLITVGRVTQSWPKLARTWFHGLLAVVAAYGLYKAIPGFTDERVAIHPASLFSLVGKTDRDRAQAVTPDNATDAWTEVLSIVGPGEAVAYDDSFGLIGQLWPPHGQGRIVYLDQHKLRTEEEVVTWLQAEHVRIAVLARPPTTDGQIAQRRPDVFSLRFPCPPATEFACDVYEVRAKVR